MKVKVMMPNEPLMKNPLDPLGIADQPGDNCMDRRGDGLDLQAADMS